MRITERQFVERVRKRALLRQGFGGPAAGAGGGTVVSGLRQGIGDDCAVLAHTPQKDLLVTTDLFLEGIHFRRHWQEPASLGHKALARGLSDVAAMGGIPRYAFLSLGLPRRTDQRWLNGFLAGFLRLAAASKVVLAGGDTGSSASGFLADVMVVGEVPRNQALLRSGACPGDEIWVTGTLGTAALGLAVLQKGRNLRRSHVAFPAFCYPQPRLGIGRYLCRQKLASAMMDVSDGLSIDLARLCEASGVGACIVEAALPRLEQTALRHALHGGEDLELLFTVPPERSRRLPRRLGTVPLTRIGKITSERQLWLIRDRRKQPLPILGFEHF